MILLTGHRGFIGSVLFDTLHKLHDEGLLKEDVLGYDLKEGDDIRNYFKLYEVFKNNNITTVIHCAALAGVRTGELFPDEYISTNVNGTQNLLNLSKEFRINKFLFFSSSSVYGNATPPNREDDPVQPDSLYGVTKAAGELLCKMSPVPTIAIRPFTVYGENGRPDQVIYKWINQIKVGKPITFYGDGKTNRGYTYVGDLVQGIVSLVLVDWNTLEHTVVNMGGNEIITLEHLLEIFKDAVKDEFGVEKLPLPSCDVPANYANIEYAKKLANFNPQTNFVVKVTEIIKLELYGTLD